MGFRELFYYWPTPVFGRRDLVCLDGTAMARKYNSGHTGDKNKGPANSRRLYTGHRINNFRGKTL